MSVRIASGLRHACAMLDPRGEAPAVMFPIVAAAAKARSRRGAASRLLALALLAVFALGQAWSVGAVPARAAHAVAQADAVHAVAASVSGAEVENGRHPATDASDDAGCRLSCTIVLVASTPFVAELRARHVWLTSDPSERASHVGAPPDHRPRAEPDRVAAAIERTRSS